MRSNLKFFVPIFKKWRAQGKQSLPVSRDRDKNGNKRVHAKHHPVRPKADTSSGQDQFKTCPFYKIPVLDKRDF